MSQTSPNPTSGSENRNALQERLPETPVAAYQRPQGYGEYQFNNDALAEDGGIDFYRYLRVLTKYRNLIFGTIVTAVVLAAAVTYLITPIYRATVAIQIDREAMKVVKGDDIEPNGTQGTGVEFYQTQYELLSSRSLAEKVISSASLLNDQQFNVQNRSMLDTMLSWVYGDRTDPSKLNAASPEVRLRVVTGRVLKGLTVTPVRNSKVVHLSIDHPNPAVAQRLANAYADSYIAVNLERRFDATAYARKFLDDRLQQLKAKLEESEKQLVKYAQDQGIINLDNNKSLSATDLESINARLAEARTDRIKKELLWKQAQNVNGLGLKEILDSPAIQANLKQRADLESEYQQKLATFKPAYPSMVELRNRILEVNRQIEADAGSIKQSIQAAYVAAKSNEDQLQAMLATSKTQVTDQRDRSIQYNILKREVDTNRTLYNGLLQRYKEIGVAAGVGTNNISIIDHADLPQRPKSPNFPLNLAIAGIVGLILGCMAALGLDYLDDSFKAPEDLEREVGISVVGVIPKPEGSTDVRLELEDQRSSMAEAYRSLRTGLQFSTSEGLPRTMLITSSKPSEGKTTTAVNLSMTLAKIGLRILLIDADLRKASLHKKMNVPNELGLSNYLAGGNTPEEVVQASENEKLVLMTSGPLPPNPAELLSGPKFAALLSLAAESFDVVVIDGPPIMGLADAPLISNLVRATLLIVAANDTRRNVVRTALRRLHQARANVIGAVLNKFDFKLTGYGYGYGYGAYDYYGYGEDVKKLAGRGAE